MSPRGGGPQVQNGCEAVVSEEETKAAKQGARGDRGSRKQNERLVIDLSNELQIISQLSLDSLRENSA